MRQTSNLYSKQNSKETKHYIGGDKKVMKKSLSLLVAAAMTLSTASVAFAADGATTTELSTQAKFDALKAAGVFSGFPDGSAGLDKEMTRAEFAKVLTKLSELAENSAANVYSDVAKTHWAAGFIGAASEAGLLNGLGAGKFGPSGKVTIEQIAKVADLVAGVEPSDKEVTGKVSAWAKGFVAAAIEAGLLPELPSYQVNATRGQLVDVAYDLAQPVEKDLKAVEAKQSGAKKVTVKFNREAVAAEKTALTYELKSGLTTYPVTATFAADNKSVDLAVAYLPAGDYTVTVKGSDAINVKVEDEAAKKVDIAVTALQQVADQDLGVKVYNQFGEEMSGVNTQISSYNVTKTKQLTPGNQLDLNVGGADEAAINDVISVTAIVPSAGLSVNKQLKVINGSAATSIKLDQVQPIAGDARISVKDGYVLPLTLVDAAGQKVVLPNGDIDLTGAAGPKSVTYAGLVFYVSDNTIVEKFTVTDGVIKFETKKAGTVFVTVTNGAAAASAQTSIVVNDAAKVKTFELGNSGKLIVKGEKAVLPFTAVDTFGAAIAAKDAVLTNVKFNAFGSEIVPVKNAKGELEFNFGQTGPTTIYVYVDGVLQTKSVSINVADVAVYKAVQKVDVATTLEVDAQVTLNQDNILLVDNYGRTSNVAADKFTVTSGKTSVVDYVGGKLVAKAEGTAEITVSSTANAGITDKKFTVTVVKNSAITSYAVDTIDTLFGSTTAADTVGYEKAVALVGKTAGGTTVALKSTAPDFVTSSDESVLKVAADGTTVVGQKAGKSTVAAYLNGSKVAEREVTVATDAKVVKTVEFDKDEYTTTVGADITPAAKVTVKDQYGVVLTTSVGKILVSDPSIATVTGGAVKGIKVGSTTITYVASNGTTDSAVLVVNP
ncbi:S-layer homology domain-containing protein [Paenibacillus lignilyticus]|uniref:S-layer homology domain-containing protein n=1 Tax=Paenibacillus lignilyticus TaxID=1172615 RepID=A0ABS5CM25_9BACL|nr:S-layer homology domain-containing protein [Paenibacillus lignilyticus]MBP3966918.1 S-layer homology domain-containing protein [Paenibacillus lignilyticus]